MSGTTNITLSVPDGSYFHDGQLCTPVSWTGVLTFFLSNYVVHVATVQFYPGEHGFPKYFALITAFLFPTAGLARGLDRIFRCAIRSKSELTKAAKSGALLMVIRAGGWRPTKEQKLADVVEHLPSPGTCPETFSTKEAEKWLRTYTGRALGRDPQFLEQFDNSNHVCGSIELQSEGNGHGSLCRRLIYVYRDLWTQHSLYRWTFLGVNDFDANRDTRVIHGESTLPDGYTYAFVPRDALVEPIDESVASGPDFVVSRPEDVLHPSYDLTAGLSSIVQLLFGLATLYDAVGPQIERFGYAAFGLTVIPYTLMSFINLIGSIATPVYDSTYLVDSEMLQEARSRGGSFKNVVGKLKSSVELGDAAYINTPRRTFQLAPTESPSEPGSASFPPTLLGSRTGEKERGEIVNPSHASPSLVEPKIDEKEANETVVTEQTVECGNESQIERSMSEEQSSSSDGPSFQFAPSMFRTIQQYSNANAIEKDMNVRLGNRTDFYVTCYTIEGASHFLEQQRPKLKKSRDLEGQKHGTVTVEESANAPSGIQLGVICVPSHTPIVRAEGVSTKDDGDLGAWVIWMVGAIALLPWGLLSKFSGGGSTTAQRVCVMLWFAIGILFGWFISRLRSEPPKDRVDKDDVWLRGGSQVTIALATLIIAAAPIAGFVEVGLMYAAYGNCNKLG